MGFNVADADLQDTQALPSDAGSSDSESTASFDLGLTDDSDFGAECELEISAPSLTSTELPNGTEMHYQVEESSDDGDSDSWTAIAEKVIDQVGADGSGADAVTERVRLPSDIEGYVRVTAVGDDGSGTLGDCSDSSMEVRLLF